ncbi:B3/4 domain-containing protein [Dactylosporangium sp. NPDC051541]|uniref:B3/4 domain-containing protein n=1 Tax=Dactylosporangium sp. NPDC051541 TaxID=3363977 RepID=UPI0037B3C041
MRFQHDEAIWRDFPALVPGLLYVEGISPELDVKPGPFLAMARERLAGAAESAWPEIQAWRRAFAAQGLRPTQYRCASESLLRRLRREGDLPALHPLVDVCNAVSVAYAIPVAALDLERVAGDLTVGYATGAETYETFAGTVEHPDPREVVFADAEGFAHARRWTNRQSGRSAIRPATSRALVVAEALHATGPADVAALVADLAAALRSAGADVVRTAILSAGEPGFDPGQ